MHGSKDHRYRSFLKELSRFRSDIPVETDPLRLLAYGTDASFYRLVPEIAVTVRDEPDIVEVIRQAESLGLPLTFRAAGTSLSGQAITDSILVRLGPQWKEYRILENAEKIRLQPGIIGSVANRSLLPFGKKIGPDPASIDSCMIGGIVANNASGMCCGVAQNSYQTLSAMRIVFADGTLLDTGDPESRSAFAVKRPDILGRITELRDRVAADKALTDRIREKFRIKNTTGYSLNALVDFTDPFEIIQHLMVGSEGTLGFIAEVIFDTVTEDPHKASSLMLFPDMKSACEAVQALKPQPVAAVEMMDRASLRSVEGKPGMPDYLSSLSPTASALLVETRAQTAALLQEQVGSTIESVGSIPVVRDLSFTHLPEEFTKLWNIRKGLFPAVGAVRETGTTVIIEDVAFPIEGLDRATLELQSLLDKYRYNEAIIFGHALEGNLHFVFTQDFNRGEEVDRYRRFMDEVVEMVVDRYDGSLKAEHGTGRNMAPFVEKEWGKDAYQLMKEIKKIFDPTGILNPGVIINPDPEAHLKDLKPLPPANPEVDKCIECGFCEPVCPSKDITFTPRQRITSYREICRLSASGDDEKRTKALKKAYDYPGNQTCAADGLCATRCPVSIDTAKLTKFLRSETVTPITDYTAEKIADNFKGVSMGLRGTLKAASATHKVLGTHAMESATGALHKVTRGKVPLWNREMPTSAPKVDPTPQGREGGLQVVYFPSCISRTMGTSKDDPETRPLPAVTLSVLEKAGCRVSFVENMEALCCGQPFESKGFMEHADRKLKELEAALLAASNDGEIPILCDTSPCLYRMQQGMDKRLKLYEPVVFVHEFLMERLRFLKTPGPVTIHTTCTARKMGLEVPLKELAEACCKKVVVPDDIFCCGFAGDRGFSVPELNKAALEGLREKTCGCESGYSTSRGCEIGLSLHSGIPYSSILYLVDRCTSSVE